jgi:hypothetical protein
MKTSEMPRPQGCCNLSPLTPEMFNHLFQDIRVENIKQKQNKEEFEDARTSIY